MKLPGLGHVLAGFPLQLPTLEAIKTQIEPEVFDAWQSLEIDIHQRREARRDGLQSKPVRPKTHG